MEKQVISLNKNSKLINACKKNGLPLIKPSGKFNGYGYERLPMAVIITQETELEKFYELIKQCSTETLPTKKSDEELATEWAKRLSVLSQTPLSNCLEIACNKLNCHKQSIAVLMNEDSIHPSMQRNKIIKQLKQENPFTKIKDAEHANIIVSAFRNSY